MMKHVAVINIFFLAFALNLHSQGKEIVEYNKDTIYFNFSNFYDNCTYFKDKSRLKWFKKEGIQFNICGNAVLLFKKGEKSDTLDLWHLKDYKTLNISELKDLETHLRVNKQDTLKKIFDKPYHLINKNNLFSTYIIEVLKEQEQFVIYPVYWKGQNINYLNVERRFRKPKER